jgi:putative ABC transport system substrate-binding protein
MKSLSEESFHKPRKEMKKTILALIAVWVLLGPQPSEAQKVHHVGGLIAGDEFLPTLDGFKKKMAELGYIEGKNIKYEFRDAKNDPELLKTLAAELIQSKPDLIVTSSTTATVPVAKLTLGTSLPVVFLSAGDPLRFVKSYTSSGNNITGISSSSLDLIDKRMELLKDLTPKMRRVIALQVAAAANYEASRHRTQEAAKRMGLELVEVAASKLEDFRDKTLPLISRKSGDAFLLPPVTSALVSAEQIAEHLIKEKLPSVGPNIEYAKKGFTAAYSSDYFSMGQQGALLVDKILKGARPTDLPIEQPSKLALVLNLQTAKAIGLRIPKEILLRADEVIE